MFWIKFINLVKKTHKPNNNTLFSYLIIINLINFFF